MAVIYSDKEVLYKGCVIDTYEHNGYEDSDFYAVCVNPETGEIDKVEYDSTRYPNGGYADIDITEDNFRKYLVNSVASEVKDIQRQDRVKSKLVEVGKEVEVVKGRKVAKGTKGKVFWLKEVNYDKYDRWYKAVTKIGIKDEQGNVYWTYAHNVNVINPENYIRPIKDIIKEVKKKHSNMYLNFKKKFNW